MKAEELAKQPLEATEFLVFDTETTGLSPTMGHRICEIGMVRAKMGGPLRQIKSRVNPQRPMDPMAEAVHGHSLASLKDCPVFASIAGGVKKRLEGQVVVGWNVMFDIRFLAAEWRMLRWDPPEVLILDAQTILAKILRPHRKALDVVAGLMGIEFDAHQAQDDALATWTILEALLKDREDYDLEKVSDLIAIQGKALTWPPSLWESSEVHAGIRQALEEERTLKFSYENKDGGVFTCRAAPVDVAGKYMVALSRGERRTYRRDRMSNVVLVG